MPDIPITVACGEYDRIRALREGTVHIEGCAVTYSPVEAEPLFVRNLKNQEFDVSEMSFSTYITLKDQGAHHYTAIPVFLSRAFRHSAIFVRTDRGSPRRPTSKASASARPNISPPCWCGCAACCPTNTASSRPTCAGGSAAWSSRLAEDGERPSRWRASRSRTSRPTRRSPACWPTARSMRLLGAPAVMLPQGRAQRGTAVRRLPARSSRPITARAASIR